MSSTIRHPALGKLVHRGVEFTHAQTPFPSDSFPGMVAQVTGGNPKTTGIYYDDSWNRAQLPAGTTNCVGVTPGVEVTYFEQADRDPSRLDAGQGLAGLPGSILKMTGDATTQLDSNQLPVDPGTCTPVYPHQYLMVNTIFEVARAAGLRTAWSDKHVAYEVLNGPSGTGVQDLFAPEINRDAPTAGASNDWTTDNALTMQYDSYKVQSVLNEIYGYDHCGTSSVGTPAIFGMNFPDRLDRREASDLGRADRRLPRRRRHAWAAAAAGTRLHQRERRCDDGRDQGAPPSKRHGDHPLGRARPVAPNTFGADPHPRRADHRRPQRRLDSGTPWRRRPRRLLAQRRRNAHLAQRPLGRSGVVCEELPAQPLRQR
jgi:hypothetical protein